MLLLAMMLVPLALAAPAGAGGADPCDLLSKKQVRAIMGVKPFGSPIPDNGGCSWETDPVERDGYSYVFPEVKSLDEAIAGYPDSAPLATRPGAPTRSSRSTAWATRRTRARRCS